MSLLRNKLRMTNDECRKETFLRQSKGDRHEPGGAQGIDRDRKDEAPKGAFILSPLPGLFFMHAYQGFASLIPGYSLSPHPGLPMVPDGYSLSLTATFDGGGQIIFHFARGSRFFAKESSGFVIRHS
jgi:hypothetical protein